MRDRWVTLTQALADAFLAGEWTALGLIERGVYVLEQRPDWLPDLALAVLAANPAAPAGQPRRLAREIAASPALDPLRGLAVDPGRIPAVVRRLSVPTRSVLGPPWDNVRTVADRLGLTIGELDWFADPQERLGRAPGGRLQHYRHRWLTTRTGARLLESPLQRLAQAQRVVLHDLLDGLPVHSAAHGFVRGRSVLTGARPHTGAAVVATVDLRWFFTAITAPRVAGALRARGIAEPVAHLLAALATHSTPVAVLRAVPHAALGAESAWLLRRLLAREHLPQGAPTSPALSNLVCRRLDRRLAGYAAAAGAAYTRYADDLTFSGPATLRRRMPALLEAVRNIVVQEGFSVNENKTRVRAADQRQQVTGIVVNQHPAVPQEDYDRLRAILHNCATHGPEEQNRDGHAHFADHLRGRIAWVAALSPERGNRLRELYARIDWSQHSDPGGA